ncbi:MAG TPA: 50S ribosomal protein L27 [Candidatus Bathyarchaeia archaeon]|nr:50S ribosomal protein L27 [Candidatus Bathyarchaeia archaeon]
MSRVGRTSSKFYRETRGLKISGGQAVKSGSILTRQGHRWKPGINVVGEMSLTAKCDGEIYFTRKKNRYNKVVTYVNVRPEAK